MIYDLEICSFDLEFTAIAPPPHPPPFIIMLLKRYSFVLNSSSSRYKKGRKRFMSVHIFMDNLGLRSKSQCESHHQELTGSSKELLTGSPKKPLTDSVQHLTAQDLEQADASKKTGNQING